MRSKKYKFDVLIIGGGPAGNAAAIKLSEAGVRVVILERSNYKNTRIGETLPPEANVVLNSLGVWEDFIKDEHLPSPGNVSVWASDDLSEDDFLFNPYGCGWHIDRSKFDSMLSAAAENRGAKVFRGAEVSGYVQTSKNKWLVYTDFKGEKLLFEANYLLLATGRTAKIRLPLAQKRVYDRLIGAVKLLDLKVSVEDLDHRTLVEADKNGWWYSSILPQGQLVLAYMTDADLLPKNIKISEQMMDKASYTRDRIKNCEWNDETYLFPACTYFNLQFAGQKWMAIGDLAFTFDPLSSQGITNALKRGMDSAEIIIECLQKNEKPLKEFINQTNSFFSQYLIKKQAYYRLEHRWSKFPFWQRRHSL